MKIKILLYFLVGMVVLASCKKTLEDEFKNPDSYVPDESKTIAGMFAGMSYQWKIFVQDYGEMYWSLNGGTSVPGYIQISQRYVTPRYSWFQTYDDLLLGNGFDPGTLGSRFNETYTRLNNLPTMQSLLDGLSGVEKTDNQIYVTLGSVIKDYTFARSVDLFNSIPYSESLQGTNGLLTPKYDDPKVIYESLIDDLKVLGDRLPAEFSAMSATGKSTFAAQDIIFKGDPNLWVQYINALRLKLSVRISGVDEAFAKQHIQDALTKPLPSVDMTWALNFTQTPPGGITWLRGMYENTFASFIPDVVMKRLNYGTTAYEPGIDDPRLPVLALPTKLNGNNDYRGVTYNIDAQTPDYQANLDTSKSKTAYYPYADNLPRSLRENAKSVWNIGTFAWNEYFPVYMFSKAELDLLLAEIAVKGLGSTGKTADQHVVDALSNSTDFWYSINALSKFNVTVKAVHPDKPDAAAITAYGQALRARFVAAAGVEDKMEVIMQQRYIHLNVMNYLDLFADLRRTRHPKLEALTYQGKVMRPLVERLRYPSSELSTNEQNFLKVAAEDNLTSHIFWVPDSKRAESYYRSGYAYP